MSNVKAGDLAYVKANDMRLDNGKVVTVLRLAVEGDLYPDRARKVANPSGLLAWWVRGPELHVVDFRGNVLGTSPEVPFADSALRPITPPAGTITDAEVTNLYRTKPVKELV